MFVTRQLKNDCIVQLLVIKKGSFLGIFEQLQRANISFVIYVRLSFLSHGTTLLPMDRFS